MRVLFVSQYFYPESFKGNDVAFDLVQKGHDVTVLTGKPNYPKGDFYDGYSFFSSDSEVINGVNVIRVPLFPRKNGNGFYLALNYFSFVFFSFLYFLFKLRNEYDVIFVQQLSPVFSALPGVWMKKRYNIPLVVWVLDLWPESIQAASNIKSKFVISWITKIVERIYRASDHILISSKNFENSIKDKCPPDKKISYFPNWAEDVFIQKIDNNPNDIKLPSGFNVVFAGNIGEAQDFENVLKAAKLTKDQGINWVLVGDGRKVDWIKKKIISENLSNVYLLGRYPLDKMPLFFKKADVLLVSLKDEPIFGLTVPAKIQAYMASGCIVLAMLNGEAAELIEEAECGFAVSAGDYYALSKKAIYLNSLSENQRKEMKKSALNYYSSNFEKRRLLKELEELLKSYNN
ncbi:glycosyltransferase family 4 protein [Marinifilum caeruleilacunae]|uniref:Glycosyltransferase WbuB n=1 Tax=Marinifilum caeruleilacunae TaxID=2499076 RepID=A0ABX1WSY8_9BACT|nr:glycosyltransferase family 4 protein [Marinifilum caeruleilacunae]NOU59234.1 glycosyltransferase WbuB [Marinifilum caeruleilacunae]